MTTHWDDEKLTAYALNELDEAERASLEAFLKTDETARRTVAEFQAAAKLAAEAALDTATLGLTYAQERSIRERARKSDAPSSSRTPARTSWFTRHKLALAAGVLVVVSIALTTIIQGSLRTTRMGYQFDSFGRPKSVASPKGEAPTAGRALYERPASYQYQWGKAAAPAPAAAEAPAPAPQAQGGAMGGIANEQLNSLGYVEGKEEAGRIAHFGVRHLASTDQDAGAAADGVPKAPGVGGDSTSQNQEALQKAVSPTDKEGATLDRYLIKNVTLQLETDNAEQASKQLTESIIAVGGYVSNLRERVDGLGRRNITLQVRMPAEQLDGAVGTIEALGRLMSKQVNTDDVTEEYVDTDARIRNLKKTEERLLEHLSQSMLMENTLKVEQEMTRVREQLERLEGRLRYLSHSVRFSTITVNLIETPKAESIIPVDTFSSGKVLSEATRSLVEFARALWIKMIWLGVWSPVWGIIAIAIWAVYRLLRKAVHLQLW